MARFVTPEEFGIVAVLSLFVALGSVLAEGGLSSALIQREHISRVDESTVFWINACAGLLLALLFFSISDLMAIIFEKPEIRLLMVLMGCIVLLNSLAVVPVAILTKALDFRTQMIAAVAAVLIASAIAITLAVLDFGVWAVAAQIFLTSAGIVVFTSVLGGWRPLFTFSRKSAVTLFRFGGYVLVANLIDTFYSRAYTVLIGKRIGLPELGIYDRAEQAKQLPANFFTTIFGRLLLPVFSERAREAGGLRVSMQASLKCLMLVNMPVMLLLAVLGEPLILTLFGPAWAEAIVPFKILCLGAALWPFQLVNVSALIAAGHSKLILSIEIPKKLLGLIFLIVGVSFGLEGVAWSQVLFALTAFLINAYFSGKLLGYGVLNQLIDIVPMAMISILAAVVTFHLNELLALANFLKVGIAGGVGALGYIAVCFVFRISALNEAINVGRVLLARNDG